MNGYVHFDHTLGRADGAIEKLEKAREDKINYSKRSIIWAAGIAAVVAIGILIGGPAGLAVAVFLGLCYTGAHGADLAEKRKFLSKTADMITYIRYNRKKVNTELADTPNILNAIKATERKKKGKTVAQYYKARSVINDQLNNGKVDRLQFRKAHALLKRIREHNTTISNFD